ncbi:hypothetical protein LguiB_021078 [Lonicera macranthoides]
MEKEGVLRLDIIVKGALQILFLMSKLGMVTLPKDHVLRRRKQNIKGEDPATLSLDNDSTHNKQGYLSVIVLPFLLHLGFMSATAFFVMHVQVQEALHANVTKLDHDWEPCSDVITKWLDSTTTVIPLLKELSTTKCFLFGSSVETKEIE